jgi:Ribosomal protein L10
MAITAEKKNRVAEMKEKLSQGKGIVLADYRGISVALDTKLRRQMREAGVEYRVAKNAFTRIAAEELGISGLDEHLTGPVAIAISYEDAVAPAKVLAGFSKENKVLKLKAGILDGKVINADEVNALAELPSKEVLLAKLMGSMNAPISGFVNVLHGNLRGLVCALDAIRAQKESA